MVSAEPFSNGTGTLQCLQKEMATYRHWSVSLWRDPDDVSHCRILSRDKTEWRLISATLCGWRRCFVADQLWVMTVIREEEEVMRRLLPVTLCIDCLVDCRDAAAAITLSVICLVCNPLVRSSPLNLKWCTTYSVLPLVCCSEIRSADCVRCNCPSWEGDMMKPDTLMVLQRQAAEIGLCRHACHHGQVSNYPLPAVATFMHSAVKYILI